MRVKGCNQPSNSFLLFIDQKAVSCNLLIVSRSFVLFFFFRDVAFETFTLETNERFTAVRLMQDSAINMHLHFCLRARKRAFVVAK